MYIFIEIALRHVCSPVNLLHFFRTPFLKNTSGWLLLECFLLRKIFTVVTNSSEIRIGVSQKLTRINSIKLKNANESFYPSKVLGLFCQID